MEPSRSQPAPTAEELLLRRLAALVEVLDPVPASTLADARAMFVLAPLVPAPPVRPAKG